MRALLVGFIALGFVLPAATAVASEPRFTDGDLVARKMEAHYNGAKYKKSLNASNPGTRLTTRVLCALEDYGPGIANEVQCTAKMRVQRDTDERWVIARVEWQLQKRTAKRAKLRWTVTGPQVFESDYEIIAPSAFGLTRF